jgi:hypothetical protein
MNGRVKLEVRVGEKKDNMVGWHEWWDMPN